MRTDIAWFDFASGELSPRMKGRIDVGKYYNGAESVLNMVVQPQGGATRRPGTAFVANQAFAATPSRLIPFVFSTVQTYVVELAGGVAQFYANNGQVTSGGSPVQLAIPYAAGDLASIGYTQSDDQLYLCHLNYPPMVMDRTGANNFSLNPLVLRDGPYLAENATTTTLTLSTYSGTVTVTASSTAGINNDTGWQASDVGRHLRVRYNGTWAWFIIASIVSSTVCTATLQPPLNNGAFQVDGTPWQPNTTYPVGAIVTNNSTTYWGDNGHTFVAKVGGYSGTGSGSGNTGPSGTGGAINDGTVTWAWTYGLISQTTQWMLGKYYPGNWPSLCMIWQNRLLLAGTASGPNSMDASVIADFTNFAPTQADDSVTEINGLSQDIDDDQVNAIQWLSPAGSAQTMQLGLGTSAGEVILQPATQNSALSADNVQVYRETTLGSAANLRPVRIGKSLLFANRAGLKLHEWTFQWQVNGYVGPDLAVLADHLPAPGIVGMAWQQNPHGVLWCWRADGALIGLTYLRDQEVVAWHHHQLGGSYYGGPPLIDSLCVIPSTTGAPDQLWLAVLRTVGGVPFRTVEVMQPYFTNMPLEAAWFVDCAVAAGLTAQATGLTITGLTNTAAEGEPIALTGTATLVAGSSVFASVGQMLRVNGGSIRLSAVASQTQATGTVVAPLTSMAPVAAGGWTLDTPATSWSGEAALAGETLSVLADGAVLPAVVVDATGGLTLTTPATRVVAGYHAPSKVVTMPAEPGRGAGAPASGKAGRLDTIYLRLMETVGGQFGQRLQDAATQAITETLDPIPARWWGDQMDGPARLFSGVLRLNPPGGDDPERRLVVLQDQPLPMTVLGISGRMDIEEVTPQ